MKFLFSGPAVAVGLVQGIVTMGIIVILGVVAVVVGLATIWMEEVSRDSKTQ